jgi:hypothetical protein
VLAAGQPSQVFAAAPGSLARLGRHAADGARHVALGLDHVLFLATLLLPAVARRTRAGWIVAADARAALLPVIGAVTAFTVAHALTLSLALLDLIDVPARWVEPAVALTVALAALNALWPVVVGRLWIAALAFGLIHGAAIASAFTPLAPGSGALGIALLGFNLGVELAQLALVALVVPLAFALRHRRAYRQLVVQGGSLAVLAIALVWLVERLAA